ncbi:uncharacterized protein PAC_19340 [Phialocephala subalpina]|uniref:Uncharacterized protein n=1 Tax=Phialocephala subalpina TaxID=576137 RepID=A0A1L7XWS3_9HELO|nr:uncharacterized protein PAC_19340 [Phialocephala subalpina]
MNLTAELGLITKTHDRHYHLDLQILGDETSNSLLNLIEAASKSGTLKRFAPSEFGVDGLPFPFTAFKVAAIEKLRATPSLEYAIFITGFFLDFYGMPHAPTYMPGVSVIVDVENMKAAIPGEGNTPTVFTYTKDVAEFIAASLDLPKWRQRSIIAVVHDSPQDLRARKNTELASNIPRYEFFPKNSLVGLVLVFGIAMEEGLFDFKGQSLNEMLPEIKSMSVEVFLQTYWGSK